jgi:Preprotein translocase subunit SecA (ATPase, RNA helicase)
MGFLQKLFDRNERDVARYRKMVDKVNALEPEFQKLSDAELRAKTDEFRERYRAAMDKQGGEEALEAREKEAKAGGNSRELHILRDAMNAALDPLLPEAFAACREASRRVLGMRHFDVQLIGGMVQHDGRIAELKTGEGKTLMCTLATYLNALAGRGVHVVTVNDYLVKRDAVWMGALFHSLGLSVGILQGASPETGEGGGTFLYDPEYEDPSVDGLDARYRYARPTMNRREAYQCDITYGTSAEFGFDYLRDNMAPSLDYIVQTRGHNFAIVDECDSNLIDEARTPLIISGTAERSSDLYYTMTKIIPTLERGEQKKDKYDTETDEKDYVVDEKAKSATFTERGLEKMERALGIDDISSPENLQYMQHAVAALKAHAVFEKDRDYVIRENREGKPEIVIVDEFTGRLMFGRRWSDGLHQAVEAKEGIAIENEQQTLATITIQNYFRLYRKLAGMTGTAKTEEDEFRKIYALDVVQVPTNRAMIRKDMPDIIYKTEEAKLRGIVTEILQVHCRQQPVLVGTRSIEMSERISTRLTFEALEKLCVIHLIRQALEAKSKEVGNERYSEISALLNTKLDQISMMKLAPIAKELGVDVKLVDRDKPGSAIGALMQYLEIDEAGRDTLVEALMHGIPHNILNAKFHEQEARIIAEAGRKGAVTIATNMAGRGVDILLGGTHYKEVTEADGSVKPVDYSYRRGGRAARGPNAIAHVVTKSDAAADPESMGPAGAGTIALGEESVDYAKQREEVRALGGLYILGTERHESRRIDNQLRGRAGRQGDPGVSKFHVSLEDYLWRVFGDRNNAMQAGLMSQWAEDQAVDTPFLSRLIERAQKKVEQHNFDARKHVLEYDDVMNVQREVIYRERRKILEGAELRDTLLNHLHSVVDSAVNLYLSDTVPPEEWDRSGLLENLSTIFPVMQFVSLEDAEQLEKPELVDRLHEAADQAYADKEAEFGPEVMREVERHITLRQIDQTWVHHLADMDFLREGIGLRGYGQVDPLVAYKKEALELFEQTQAGIQTDVLRNLFMAQVQFEQPAPETSIFDQMLAAGGLQTEDGQELDEETLRRLMASMGLGNGDGAESEGEDGEANGGVPVGAVASAGPRPVMAPPQNNPLLVAAAEAARKKASAELDFSNVGPNDLCPCGSGKKFKKCHRNA